MSAAPPKQIRLLVSVRNAAEAISALYGGADIIDVKEPSRGPLGMAEATVMNEVVAAVAGRAPVSVAMGELQDNPPMRLIPPGVTYAKIGLAGVAAGWQQRLASKFAEAPHVQPIAVAYFHCSSRSQPPSVDDVVAWAVEHKAHGILFDTCKKDGTNLFRSMSPRELPSAYYDMLLSSFTTHIRSIQARGLLLALAGSLRGPSFEDALAMGPDIVGVRGAVCSDNNRKAVIEAPRVRALADLIAARNAQPAMSAG